LDGARPVARKTTELGIRNEYWTGNRLIKTRWPGIIDLTKPARKLRLSSLG
jgi:hypothetical protein